MSAGTSAYRMCVCAGKPVATASERLRTSLARGQAVFMCHVTSIYGPVYTGVDLFEWKENQRRTTAECKTG